MMTQDNLCYNHPAQDDDSLLSSLAGVPLTRMARFATCAIWAAFWLARVLLTDALDIGFSEPETLVKQLIGENPFDQGFSIVMAWLTFEVAFIIWAPLKGGFEVLIAKTPKMDFARGIAEKMPRDKFIQVVEKKLTPEELEAIVARQRALSRSRENGQDGA